LDLELSLLRSEVNQNQFWLGGSQLSPIVVDPRRGGWPYKCFQQVAFSRKSDQGLGKAW